MCDLGVLQPSTSHCSAVKAAPLLQRERKMASKDAANSATGWGDTAGVWHPENDRGASGS